MYNTSQLSIQDKSTKKTISLTTYRALFIAKLLHQRPLSFDEITNMLSTDKFLSKSCHKDTISNSINSLREAGFNIEKPKPSNNFKFCLISQPFKINISQKQVEILNLIRNSLYYQNNYKIIFDLNKIYDKIKCLSNNENLIEYLESSNHLRNIDKDILEKLSILCNQKANAKIVYNSPVNKKESFSVKTEKIVFENNRLYLWCYTYKYNSLAYLRIDKISFVDKDTEISQSDISINNYIEYELTGNAAKKFIPREDETIIEKNSKKIVVRANVINKFNFHQRIMAYSEECKILSPQSAKELFIEHLNKIIGVYENEN